MERGRWGLLWSAATALILAASPARAEDAKRAEAERAFAAGDQAYAAGQNLAAARAYENAYALAPLPEITFSIAQAYRRHYFEDPDVRWLQMAQALYKRYLDEAPDGARRGHAVTHLANIAVLLTEAHSDNPEPPKATPTEFLVSSLTVGAKASIDGAEPRDVPVVQAIAPGPHKVIVSAPGYFDSELGVKALEGRMIIVPTELKPRPGSLDVDVERGAQVWIDGRLAARTPLAHPISLPAGSYTVSITRAGRRTDTRSVKLDRGEKESVRAHLKTSDQRLAAYGLFAGSAALALAGAALAIVAGVSEMQATDTDAIPGQQHRPLTPEEASSFNSALARRDLARTLAIAGFASGAALGITATFVFVFDRPTPSIAAQDGATTVGVQVAGAF